MHFAPLLMTSVPGLHCWIYLLTAFTERGNSKAPIPFIEQAISIVLSDDCWMIAMNACTKTSLKSLGTSSYFFLFHFWSAANTPHVGMPILYDTYFYVSYYFSIFRNSRFLPIKARASKALSFGLLAGMAFGKMSSNSKGHPEPGTYHQVTQIESARLATERICKFCLGMACISSGFLAPVPWDG